MNIKVLVIYKMFLSIINLELYDTYYLHDKYFDIIRYTYNISMLNNARCLHILSYEIVKILI